MTEDKYDINIRSYANNQRIDFARTVLLSFNSEFFQLMSNKNYRFSQEDIQMKFQMNILTQMFVYNEYADLEITIQMILELCKNDNKLNYNFKNKMQDLIVMFKRIGGEGSGITKYSV